MVKAWNILVCVVFCNVSLSHSILPVNSCNLEIETITPINCSETFNGTIKITVSGGTAPYYYKINNEEFVKYSIIEGVLSNNYDITVRDSSGCEVTLYTYIEIPEPLTIAYALENGKLIVTISEDGKYKYKLNNGNWVDSPIFNDVTEVNTISVKTEYGCEISKTINDVNITDVFKFHPNPASDYVFIMGNRKIKNIAILNAFGKRVVSQQVNKSIMKLNISNLKRGIYLIQVIDINDRRQVKKLIVN